MDITKNMKTGFACIGVLGVGAIGFLLFDGTAGNESVSIVDPTTTTGISGTSTVSTTLTTQSTSLNTTANIASTTQSTSTTKLPVVTQAPVVITPTQAPVIPTPTQAPVQTQAPKTSNTASVQVGHTVETKPQVVSGRVTVKKIDKGSNKSIKGVTMQLVGPSGATQTGTTDANGNIVFSGLSAGKYTLKEISSPNSYTPITQIQYIEISAASSVVSLTSYSVRT